ncbi:hypothetical protein AArcMg_0428 [Natrarchaeobaculum sulfurireducens]|uniref:DUF58 domain-containing protein n=1 Tax=Natrarchaeobaculum sulfurireducens TaxID=2044521 RepID=A0A346PLQ6_9EURY|nr:hypothetical protein AArc1_0437 [Natrarchaeobaculum sulfurireducens]AXR80451.1 hypothetical protein AArcMg_0428 [Natrarchaeobaculum sulfurireducens]
MVALASCLLALVLGVPALFFLAVVALGFVLVGQVSTTPAADLTLERQLDEARVRPGQSVTVTLSVTNEGGDVASDVRVVDEPPGSVPVTGGEPAFATSIRPGETVSHEYELTPPRGEFAFGPATVRLRSVTATTVATAQREPDGEGRFACETLLESVPVHEQTIQFVGPTPTDDGGTGVEFFATREYRRGDPINRIDWHRFARTGDLATVEYREERAATIVFVLDDRDDVHREPPGGGPDSFDLTLYAASRGVVASLENGNRTGVATVSGEGWVEPGAGSDVRRRAEDVIGTAHSSTTARAESTRRVGTDGGTFALDLEQRLPSRAQVVFCTPLSEEGSVAFVETLRRRGRAVTVVSPDMTTGVAAPVFSSGARIDRLRRANRIDELRGLGATVVDWNLEEPLSVDLRRTIRTLVRRGRAAGVRGGGRP